MSARIAALRTLLADAERDTARVDFLEAHPHCVGASNGRWLVLMGRALGRIAYDWREAVDDAREAPGSEARLPRWVGA